MLGSIERIQTNPISSKYDCFFISIKLQTTANNLIFLLNKIQISSFVPPGYPNIKYSYFIINIFTNLSPLLLLFFQ